MRKFFFAAALAVASLFGTASSADAAFQMRITSSAQAGSLVIEDGLLGDANGLTGAITFIGGRGGFTIQVNTGLSKPATGTPEAPDMDLAFVVVKTTPGVETLTIEISDQGYTTTPAPLGMLFGGTAAPLTTATYTAGTGLDNALFNTADASGTIGPLGPGAFSGTTNFIVPSDPSPGNGYSLTLRVVINAAGPGTTSGDASLVATPAPAGLVLALAGLPVFGLGAYIRRRRAAKA